MILYVQFRNYQSSFSFETEKHDVVHNITYFIVTMLVNYQSKFHLKIYSRPPS